MKLLPVLKVLMVVVMGLVVLSNVHAQPAKDDPLYQTVARLDASLFDAYNHCDLEKLAAFAADDLEFYHDQSGLSRGKQKFVDGVKNYICGKVQRELVPGSLEIYPLKGYGAVEIGVHRFHHPGSVGPDEVGEAKFVMLWELKDDSWKLTRVISFNHFGLPPSKASSGK